MDAVVLRPKSLSLAGYPKSDTLFGALCWGIRFISGNETLEKMLEDFRNGDPPFVISSAFPCALSVATVVEYLIPMPFFTIPSKFFELSASKRMEIVGNYKKLKKVRWADASLVFDILKGRVTIYDILESIEKVKDSGKGDWCFQDYNYKDGVLSRHDVPIYKEVDMVGNAINRITSSTGENFFFYKGYAMSRRGAMYFIIKHRKNCENIVRPALRFLEDRGIGGKISSGKGAFEIIQIRTNIDEKLAEMSSGKTVLNLSTYIPTHEEIVQFKNAGTKPIYNLLVRGGVIESGLASESNPWKARTMCFGEGSLFPAIENREVYGQNPVVHDKKYKVQQYGFSFYLRGDLKLEDFT
ncbi:MAG: type III-A CRISPR-associated RAMP protein Csm4 [Methanomassiliicoccales archaeon]|nr:type III-A CRISPR-associated RAMP protein Csm4 [Methanomassiliicoccales archaeon]